MNQHFQVIRPDKAESSEHYTKKKQKIDNFDLPSLSFPGVYFDNHVENVKFIDFCGKYKVPFMQVT